MEERKKLHPIPLAGGIAFMLMTLLTCIHLVAPQISAWFGFDIRMSGLLTQLLQIAGYSTISVAMLCPKWRGLTVIGFPLLTFSWLSELQYYLLYPFGFESLFFHLLGYIFYSAFAIFSFLKKEDVLKKLRLLWCVPASLLSFFTLSLLVFEWLGLSSLIILAGFWFVGLWLAYPDGLPKAAPATHTKEGTAASTDEMMYYSLAKHVLLLIFTFGIWLYIWIYRMTGYLNRVKDEPEQKPTTELLLCMFVPFYSIFWTYKSAQKIDKLAKEKGVQSDISTLCLILAIFVGIVPPIIMQDKVNAIITSKGMAATAAPQSPAASAPVDVPAELKKYKELLDTGVITQEEFEQKKSELLK